MVVLHCNGHLECGATTFLLQICSRLKRLVLYVSGTGQCLTLFADQLHTLFQTWMCTTSSYMLMPTFPCSFVLIPNWQHCRDPGLEKLLQGLAIRNGYYTMQLITPVRCTINCVLHCYHVCAYTSSLQKVTWENWNSQQPNTIINTHSEARMLKKL